MQRVLFLLYTLALLSNSCTKKETHNCEPATLYYTPRCATIKGFVVFDNTNVTKVFQQDIDARFHGSDVKVCISYEEISSWIITADCMTAPPIKILSIKAR